MEAAGLSRVSIEAVRSRRIAARLGPLVPLAAILAIAAALRLRSFGSIAGNPFYDAAVRSMSQSWHNLFFGAFDPGAMTAIDKAPLDLWLQVASVKLFGFSSAALRLPELVAGIAAVALVYDLGRRLFGRPAGLAAAATLAVLPASVLTARSDTMDALMMALVVLAAWLIVRAAQAPERALRWMVAAGAALGLAFNVKLAEALVPLPALALLGWLALPGAAARRLRALLAGGAAFLVVALAWLVAVSLAPGPKPFPIGSTDGSAWNVVFVFDGIARLGLSTPAGSPTRSGGGPLQLLSASGDAFGMLIGTALLAALLVGGLALALRLTARGLPTGQIPRVGAAFVATWLLVGVAVFSRIGVLHARYLDALAPAVALALGAGVAALAAAAPVRRLAGWALALAVALAAALALPVAHPRPAALVVAGGLVVVLALAAAAPRPAEGAHARILARGLLGLGLAGLLVVPAASALRLAASHMSDGGEPGAMHAGDLAQLSRFLARHRDGARYELATMAAAKAGPLIARDGQRVLVLTSAYGRPLVSARELAGAVRSGSVRYALVGGAACVPGHADRTGCAPAVRWAKAHGRDVSRAAGLRRRGLLLRLHE